jgi:hypothetical protein
MALLEGRVHIPFLDLAAFVTALAGLIGKDILEKSLAHPSFTLSPGIHLLAEFALEIIHEFGSPLFGFISLVPEFGLDDIIKSGSPLFGFIGRGLGMP